MKSDSLDALLFPAASGAAIAAKPGYPTVIVPFGMVPNAPTPAFPAGFVAKPGPYGVSFTGMACAEPPIDSTSVRVRASDEKARGAKVLNWRIKELENWRIKSPIPQFPNSPNPQFAL